VPAPALPTPPTLQIATIGYGDIVPASLAETLVVLAVQIVGVMFFGLLLSTIRSALAAPTLVHGD
jgi:hypothetical protein